jgi:S-adenosylmethionine:tRNA ribosyltransferase-isomerase
VLNNTKVLPARLVGFRSQTQGRWQGLYLGSDEHGVWRILGKTRGRLQPGEMVTLIDRGLRPLFSLQLLSSLGEGQWAAKPDKAGTPIALLNEAGRVPLPPYIRDGEMVDADLIAYQTVYAETPGSVAAPTAGLHFTQKLLRDILAAGVDVTHVTLHVGIGTFRPVAVDRLEDHVMHSEWGQITAATADVLNQTRARGGRIIAIGTTSVRVLETAAQRSSFQPSTSVGNRDTIGKGPITAWSGESELFIHPPYDFKAIDGLLTNFHLPKSTLLVLVRTFGGDKLIRQAYGEAIAERYRFFSYGDAMLIL